MATLLRGTNKGANVVVHQWSNDWFMVSFGGGRVRIVNPTSLELTSDEVEKVRAGQYNGQLLKWFTLSDDGKFTRNRR
jgi:hypothetical protein